MLEVAQTQPSSHCMYLLTSLPTKADVTPSISILEASVSFPRLVTSTLTAQIHAASSMLVAKLTAYLLIIKLNIQGSCRLSRIIMQPLDKVSCISAIKMNEFILYCSRFALPLQCRTMARTITTMLTERASAAMTAAWRLRRHMLWHEQRRTTSKKAIHTRRCSSTIRMVI